MTNNNPKNRIDDLMLEAIEMQNTPSQQKKYHPQQEQASDNLQSDDDDDDKSNIDPTLKSDDNIDEKEMTGRGRRCILGIVLFLAISGAMFGILFATGALGNEDFAGIPILGDIDFEGFFDSDPYGGLVTPETPETAYRWQIPQQTGLELMILNALTDDWQPEFELALTQWDSGEPDTLTLQTQRVEVDTACEPLPGLMKVCNGDYGATDWRGLNTALFDLDEKWIYASTAQMNEYYLSRASAAHRQYTMCHEMGHGFGLPHWDTNFNNANMGNCMDYTTRPDTNQQPDVANFNFLKELYGVVGGAPSTLPPGDLETVPEQSAAPNLEHEHDGTMTAENNNNNNNEETKEEEGDNQERLRLLTVDHPRSFLSNKENTIKDIPDQVMVAYRSIVYREAVPLDGSRLRQLKSGKGFGETRLLKLGYQNFAVLIHKLGPLDDQDRSHEDV